MRIVIDLQGAQTESRYRGIGRYSISLTKAMLKQNAGHEIFLVLNGLLEETIEPLRATFEDYIPQENIRVWSSLAPVMESVQGNEWRVACAKLIREACIAALDPDIVLITSLFEGFADDAVTSITKQGLAIPCGVIFYDMIPFIHQDLYLLPDPAYKTFYLQKLTELKSADLLLAISESSANEAESYLAAKAGRIFNIGAACDAQFQPIQIPDSARNELCTRFGITKPFVLYTGGADARKNLERLVRAFSRLRPDLRATYQLVLAGRMPQWAISNLRSVAASAGLRAEQVLFPGFVTDHELVYLYNLCTAFVFPSLHEGFGLPALEAMSCGAVVLGSNTSSIPEVLGRSDILFDPLDESAITDKLSTVLASEIYRMELKAYSLEQAKNFTWNGAASKALAGIKDYLSTNAPRDTHRHDAPIAGMAQKISLLLPATIGEKSLFRLATSLADIRPAHSRRTLFVDISELAHRDARTGIQRVTRTILNELLSAPPSDYDVVPVYGTAASQGYRAIANYPAHNQACDLADELIDLSAGDIFLGLDLQHHTTLAQQQYLHTCRAKGAKVFFVVYDLLPLRFPHYWPSMAEIHANWLQVVAQCDGAVCISKSVADDLQAWLSQHGPARLRPLLIRWFHLGADIESSLPSVGLPLGMDSIVTTLSSRISFLMVGTLEPRKGHTHVLDAFDVLWADDIDANLVIVGKPGWMVDQLINRLSSHPELGKRLLWLDEASDECLQIIYKNCKCLIAASEGEGFGLPIIEAAQNGLSIIARDIPVFNEVAGEHAFYFADNSPAALAKQIQLWLNLYSQNDHPKPTGLRWLTWRQSTQQLLESILGSEGPAGPGDNLEDCTQEVSFGRVFSSSPIPSSY